MQRVWGTRSGYFIGSINSHYFMHKWLIPSANQGKEVEPVTFPSMSHAFASKARDRGYKRETKTENINRCLLCSHPFPQDFWKTEKQANWPFAPIQYGILIFHMGSDTSSQNKLKQIVYNRSPRKMAFEALPPPWFFQLDHSVYLHLQQMRHEWEQKHSSLWTSFPWCSEWTAHLHSQD